MEEGPALKLRVRDNCTGCGGCIAACPERALTLQAEHPDGRGAKRALVDHQRCTLCGACLPTCPRESLVLM